MDSNFQQYDAHVQNIEESIIYTPVSVYSCYPLVSIVGWVLAQI